MIEGQIKQAVLELMRPERKLSTVKWLTPLPLSQTM